MKNIKISDVRNNLPGLINEIIQTREEVTVTRNGRPVANIVPFRKGKSRYPLRGLPLRISKDFDKPTSEIWEALR